MRRIGNAKGESGHSKDGNARRDLTAGPAEAQLRVSPCFELRTALTRRTRQGLWTDRADYRREGFRNVRRTWVFLPTNRGRSRTNSAGSV